MRCTARALAAGLLPVVVAAGALSGCSSSKDDKGSGAGKGATASSTRTGSPDAPAPSESSGDSAGGNHGRIDYTGAATGGFDVTMSVACATAGGKLIAVTAPAPDDTDSGTVPSFVATIGSEGMATLVTKDKKTFVKLGADGMSAAKQGDTWTVTVTGTELGSVTPPGDSVTVNGHLTCTKVSGT